MLVRYWTSLCDCEFSRLKVEISVDARWVRTRSVISFSPACVDPSFSAALAFCSLEALVCSLEALPIIPQPLSTEEAANANAINFISTRFIFLPPLSFLLLFFFRVQSSILANKTSFFLYSFSCVLLWALVYQSDKAKSIAPRHFLCFEYVSTG